MISIRCSTRQVWISLWIIQSVEIAFSKIKTDLLSSFDRRSENFSRSVMAVRLRQARLSSNKKHLIFMYIFPWNAFFHKHGLIFRPFNLCQSRIYSIYQFFCKRKIISFKLFFPFFPRRKQNRTGVFSLLFPLKPCII